MRVAFTIARVDSFSCPPDKAYVYMWDTKEQGLGVKASPGGSKKYVFQGRLKSGAPIRITLGEAKGSDFKKAQKEANTYKALINRGIDPRVHRAEKVKEQESKRQEAKRAEATVGDAWKDYITEKKPSWGERHLRDHENLAKAGGEKKRRGKGKTVGGPLSPLMTMRLNAINSTTVKAWLSKEVSERPAQARLAFGALRAFINWCEDSPQFRGLVSMDVVSTRFAKQVIPPKRAKRDCLQREQLEAWFKGVRQIKNPVISAYLQALLLTGARRNELAGLKWADVDFQWGSLTIRDKVEGERTIPLTPVVASLIEPLPRRNEWVFSSPTAKSGRLQEPRIPHNRAQAVAGIEGLTLHGLRRSFGTLSEWVEVPAGIVAQIQGHKPSATAEKHYRVRPLDLLRQWHEKVEAWVLEQAGITFEPPVAGQRLRAVK